MSLSVNPAKPLRLARIVLSALRVATLHLSALALLSTQAIAEEAIEPLSIEKLNLDIEHITVSGLSSGGFMATQMHFAHSDWVNGAGMIAAGPYNCARGSLKTALGECIGEAKASLPMEALNSDIKSWESQNKIAPLKNLHDSKVWILGGTLDEKIGVSLVSELAKQYQQHVKAENIKTLLTKPFAHHFPTQNQGSNCKTSESPFIGQCAYDAAGELLAHLYGKLQAPVNAQDTNVKRFDASRIAEVAEASIAEEAYLYVPSACQSGESCQLHVSFHGCNQNHQAVGLDYVTKTGLNRWAESNRLVVFYPQTQSSNMMPFNPQGCWDWWGYTDENYATAQGTQVQAVRALVNAIAGK